MFQEFFFVAGTMARYTQAEDTKPAGTGEWRDASLRTDEHDEPFPLPTERGFPFTTGLPLHHMRAWYSTDGVDLFRESPAIGEWKWNDEHLP